MEQDKVILVVDDDLTLNEMYQERLRAEGFVVEYASNGEEALARAKENKPNVILLDIMMPKVDGFAVLERLKQDPETGHIPVIILTALIQDHQRRKGKELGADEYIVKSETMPWEVVEKIKQVMK